ncbi:MAG: TolC family protein [Caulobacteraceae bacterium]|nr:TolC family protein [Caulobacter sp.]
MLAALLLAGCAGGGRLPTADVRLPVVYEAASATTASLPAQALDRWWTLYDDPQLTTLVEEALVASPTARTALARIDQARATRAQTLAAYLPQGELTGLAQTQHTDETFGNVGVVTGDGTGAGGGTTTDPTTGLPVGGGTTSSTSGAFLTPSGDLQTYAAQFNVTYELDLFGRRLAAKRGADADVAAQRFDYEAARATLARDVATGLFQARGAAIQLADARETYRIAQNLARTAVLSAQAGLTATSDAARLETDAATAQAEVARLTAVELAGRRSLLALIGRGAAPLSSLEVSASAAPPPPVPAETPGELLRRRPDVREAEARLRSASSALKLARLALFPTFSLAPGGQYSKTAGSYSSTTSIWTVGVNATLPVLDRPRLLAAVRIERSLGVQAVVAYEQAVQNAYRDAENGLVSLAADRTRTDRLQLAVDRARFAFDAKKRGYDLGLVDLTTLLDAERTWRTATSTLSGARTTALVDSATLFQALGGGWSPQAPLRLASATAATSSR